jgi:hypothetical protein
MSEDSANTPAGLAPDDVVKKSTLQKARDAAKDMKEDNYKKWQDRGGANGDMFQAKFLAAGCIEDVLDFALNN